MYKSQSLWQIKKILIQIDLLILTHIFLNWKVICKFCKYYSTLIFLLISRFQMSIKDLNTNCNLMKLRGRWQIEAAICIYCNRALACVNGLSSHGKLTHTRDGTLSLTWFDNSEGGYMFTY